MKIQLLSEEENSKLNYYEETLLLEKSPERNPCVARTCSTARFKEPLLLEETYLKKNFF
jgi:hypothetical protein